MATSSASHRVAVAACGLALATHAAFLLRSGLSAPLPWCNHDIAAALVHGQQMRHGKALYADWVDLNPPSWYLLQEGVGALAERVGVPGQTVFHLLLTAVAAAGLCLLARTMSAREAGFPATAIGYLIVAIVGNWEVHDFGQREHLFALLFVPYYFARVLGTRLTPFFGAWLPALGFFAMMKPELLLLLVPVEIYAWRSGGRRGRLGAPALLAAGCCLPLPLLAMHSMRAVKGLLGYVVPFHLAGLYAPYNQGSGEMTRWWFSHGPAAAFLPLLAGALALLAARSGGVERRRVIVGAAVIALALAGIYRQHKFWSYHFAVVFALVVVFAGYLLERALSRIPTGMARSSLRHGLAVVVLAAPFAARVADHASELAGPPTWFDVRLRAALVSLPAGARVLALSPSVDLYPALLGLPLEPAGHYALSFVVPAMWSLQNEALRREGLDAYVADLRRVIEREAPLVIAFSPSRQALQGASMYEILAEDHGLLEGLEYREWKPWREARREGWRLFRKQGERAGRR